MRAAVEAYDVLMRARPDYGKETPDYAAGFTETLSYLTDEELGWLTHPREGLHTICKFLPTAADVFEFLRKKREPFEKFNAFGKTKAEREPADIEPDAAERERRKAFVAKTRAGTGFDVKEAAVKRELTAPTEDDVRGLRLKTPPAPVSEELKQLLWRQGYFTPKQEAAA